MGIGTSLFLIAVGAILKFAVTATVAGLSIETVGTILLVVGIIGLVLSLLWGAIWADRRGGTVVREEPAVREREYVA